MSLPVVVVQGTLKSDGTLELDAIVHAKFARQPGSQAEEIAPDAGVPIDVLAVGAGRPVWRCLCRPLLTAPVSE